MREEDLESDKNYEFLKWYILKVVGPMKDYPNLGEHQARLVLHSIDLVTHIYICLYRYRSYLLQTAKYVESPVHGHHILMALIYRGLNNYLYRPHRYDLVTPYTATWSNWDSAQYICIYILFIDRC